MHYHKYLNGYINLFFIFCLFILYSVLIILLRKVFLWHASSFSLQKEIFLLELLVSFHFCIFFLINIIFNNDCFCFVSFWFLVLILFCFVDLFIYFCCSILWLFAGCCFSFSFSWRRVDSYSIQILNHLSVLCMK